MLGTLRRLALGLVLIAAVSALLLLSDLGSRVKPAPKQTADTATPAATATASTDPAAPVTNPNAVKRPARIALLQHASQTILDNSREGIMQGLAERGWVKDRDFTLKYYNAEGDIATSQNIAKEMAGGGYDLLLTVSTVSMQSVANANRAGKTPHVFGIVSDPYVVGVGISRENHMDHPPHIAGYGTMQPVLLSFQLAKQMNPTLASVGVVYNAAEANSVAQIKVARDACAKTGLTLVESTVDNSAGVGEAAAALVARGVEAVWVCGDVTVINAIDTVVAAAKKGRIPVFTVIPPNVKRGALFDIGADYNEVGRLTGHLAGEVLDGRSPATVAVENVMPEVLTLNRQTLANLKGTWTIPPAMLLRAQLVIDENGVEKATPTPKAPPAPAPGLTQTPLNSSATAAAAALAAASRAEPGKGYKITFAAFAPEPSLESCQRGVLEGLKEFGFVEGQNLTVTRTHAQGEMVNIPQMIQNADSTDANALVTFSTPVLQSALTAAKRKPVVFTYVTDPLAAGAGKTYEDHIAHVTGIGSLPPIEDTVQIIRRTLPQVKTLGTIYNSGEANSVKIISLLRESAKRAGLELVELTAASSNEVLQAMQALVSRRIDAFYLPSDNTAYLAFDAILKVSESAKLPLIIDDPDYLDKGALFACGPGYYHSGKAAAPLLARVLRGESPAKLPMANVSVNTTKFNPAAIAKLGLKIAPELIAEIEAGAAKKSAAATPNPSGKKWKIAVMLYAENPHAEQTLHGLREQLKRGALVEGRDYELKVRSAQNDTAMLNGIFDAAITDGADIFVPFSTPTLQVAAQKVKTKPIVFSAVSSPQAAGVAKSFTDHIPNVTGICTIAPYEEILDALQKYFPTYKRLGTLYCPGESGSVELLEEFQKLCKARGLTLEAVAANTLTDLPDAALSLAGKPIDAIVQISDNLAFAGFGSITRAARQVKKPLFTVNPTMIGQGAAVAVGRDYLSAGEAAARLLERVIAGENTATIPISLPPRTQFLADAANAAAVGMTLSPSFLELVAAQKAAAATAVAATPTTAATPAKPVGNPNPTGKKWKIAYVLYNETPPAEETLAGMKKRWAHSPLVEGRDYEIKMRSAQGDMASLSGIIDATLTDGADIIVPLSTPTLQMAVQKVKRTPIVFTLVANPMAAGAGKSYTDHLPNVTGVSVLAPFAAALDLVQKYYPQYKRLGTVFCPAEANSVDLKQSLEAECKRRGLVLEAVAANTPTELPDAALSMVSKQIDAVLQISDNMSSAGFTAIARAARTAQKPIFSLNSTGVSLGAAIGFGRDYEDAGEATVAMLERVIRGEDVAKMPFELPPKVVKVYNLDHAKAVGMTVAPGFIAEAKVQEPKSNAPKKSAAAPTASPASAPAKKTAAATPAKKWKIGLILYNETPPAEETLAGMKDAWKRSEFVEGRDYEIKVRSAQGDMGLLSGIFDATLTDGADMVVTLSTPTLQMAVQKVKRVPIVFALVTNPMAAGAGKSYTDHLPNVTGIAVLAPMGEALDMIKQHFPAYKRIGTLYCPAEANAVYLKEALEDACKQRGMALETVAVNTATELTDASLSLMSRKIDVVLQIPDALSSAGFSAITRAARQAQKPLFALNGTVVPLGAAVALGRDFHNSGEAAVALIERIFRGEDPAKIPFTLPPKVTYLASVNNARAVGITLPPALLKEAKIAD